MVYFTTRLEVRDYVKRVLGEPVICVELEDSQIYQIIDDVLHELYRLLYGEATVKDYMAVHLQAGQDTYKFPSEIANIGRIYMDNNNMNVNMLFTPANNFLYSDLLKMSTNLVSGQAYTLTNWYVNMHTIDSMQFLFEKRYSVLYSEYENKAKILPAPGIDGLALFAVWRKLPEEALYNNDYFRRLVRARSMQQWGLHMKKYSTTLPGGGTMNGSEIYSDGVALEDKIMEQIKKESYFTLMEIA
jgi:hypothetical protein